MPLSDLEDVDGAWNLVLDCETPVDATVRALGLVPSGYFWESLLDYAAPELTAAVEPDSEMASYCAFGERAALARVQGPGRGSPARRVTLAPGGRQRPRGRPVTSPAEVDLGGRWARAA